MREIKFRAYDHKGKQMIEHENLMMTTDGFSAIDEEAKHCRDCKEVLRRTDKKEHKAYCSDGIGSVSEYRGCICDGDALMPEWEKDVRGHYLQKGYTGADEMVELIRKTNTISYQEAARETRAHYYQLVESEARQQLLTEIKKLIKDSKSHGDSGYCGRCSFIQELIFNI